VIEKDDFQITRGGNISMSDQRKIRLTETVHGAG
jgi:hypothetical protein